LFVAHQDVADGVLLEQRVVNRQHGAARIAKNDIHALVFEGAQQAFGAAWLFIGRHT